MIIAIIIVWLLAVLTVLRIVGMGAMADFKMAEWKCKKCPHYTGSNPKFRIIYCEGMSRTPEECMECKGDE